MPLWKNAVVIGITVIVTALVTGRVVSQDAAEPTDPGRDPWRRLAAPGPEHARLARWVGVWRQEQTYWMYPGAAPQTVMTTARFRSVLGGRFIREQVTGRDKVAGGTERFRGFGFFGYDSGTRQHVFTWADNQGTMMLTGAGERDETGAIVYASTIPDPVKNRTIEIRSIARDGPEGTLLFEMHEKQPDGSWFKKLHIVSTRER